MRFDIVLTAFLATSPVDAIACAEYKDTFKSGDLKNYSSLLLSKSFPELDTETLDEWTALRGHENPYVYLINSYAQLKNGDIIQANFSSKFAMYLFHYKHNLCLNKVFFEFLVAVDTEILSRSNSEISDALWFRMIPVLKNNSETGLLVFDQYACAIETYNISSAITFEECTND